jgi:hypothetical protein
MVAKAPRTQLLYAAHHWRLDREFRFSACC